jgi:hypothetical protein
VQAAVEARQAGPAVRLSRSTKPNARSGVGVVMSNLAIMRSRAAVSSVHDPARAVAVNNQDFGWTKLHVTFRGEAG